MTTLISSHVDQALGRIINQSVMPIIGQLMEEIAKNATGGVEMDLSDHASVRLVPAEGIELRV